MIRITPTIEQQYKIERWLSVAACRSVLVVDDTMIAIKNCDLRNYIEIMIVDETSGRHKSGRYSRTIGIDWASSN